MSFADWLKRERKTARLSQGRLSEATGISRSYIARMERPGGVGLPTLAIRDKLHGVFKTSDESLVDEGVAIRRKYPQADGSISVEYEAAPKPEVRDVANTETNQPSTGLPAHLRASFLKTADWSPERQRLLENFINEIDRADEADRERLRRDEG